MLYNHDVNPVVFIVIEVIVLSPVYINHGHIGSTMDIHGSTEFEKLLSIAKVF